MAWRVSLTSPGEDAITRRISAMAVWPCKASWSCLARLSLRFFCPAADVDPPLATSVRLGAAPLPRRADPAVREPLLLLRLSCAIVRPEVSQLDNIDLAQGSERGK